MISAFLLQELSNLVVNDLIKDIMCCVAHGLGETTKSGVDHSRWHVDTHEQEALAADARIVPAVPGKETDVVV